MDIKVICFYLRIHGKPVEPETYLSNVHFNELKTLFLFDRELRFYFEILYAYFLENLLKRLFLHEFFKKYPKANYIWILRITERMI